MMKDLFCLFKDLQLQPEVYIQGRECEGDFELFSNCYHHHHHHPDRNPSENAVCIILTLC